MRVQVSTRADGSPLGCDIWLLTEGMAQPIGTQTSHQSCDGVLKKKKREDTEGPGQVSDKALRQDKQQLANYINL